MQDGEVPKLTSGQIFKDHLDDLLRDGKELKHIITAPDNVSYEVLRSSLP